MMQNINYAYKQAPWRKQLRAAAWVLVVLVIFVMIAIAYLNISAKTYAAGIKIQSLQSEQETLSNEIADLHNQLGSSTSYEKMTKKVNEKGYQIISDAYRIVYLKIPGYMEPSPEIDVPSKKITGSEPIVKSLYTRSLWDLVMDGALILGENSK